MMLFAAFVGAADVAKMRWSQIFTYDKPDCTPVVFEGWSRSKNAVARDYCLWLDVHYADGTKKWALRSDFRLGSHDWELVRDFWIPEKPVEKIEFFAFLRKGSGTAEFRDVKLERRVPSADEFFGSVRRTNRPYAEADEVEGMVFKNGHRQVSRRSVEGTSGPVSTVAPDVARVWVADSMRRVTPLTFPRSNESEAVDLEVAQAEAESAQLVVSTGTACEWTTGGVELPVLKAADGTDFKGTFVWQRVGYLARRAGYAPHPEGAESVEKWFPDPLLPAAPFRVRKGASQGLWLTVTAARDAKPGVYTGTIVVLGNGRAAARVPVSVRVRAFAQPTTFGMPTAFCIMDGFTRAQYPDQYEAMRRQSWDVMLDHRLNPDDISRTSPPPIDDLLHAKARGMNRFNILNLVPPPKDKKAKWVCYSSPEETENPAFYDYVKKTLTPYVAELRKHDLVKFAYLYGFDERQKEYYPGIDRLWKQLKADFPDIPLMTTAMMYKDMAAGKDYPCLETTDWYCPLTSYYQPELSARLRAKGKQVWWYTCCGPKYPYANMASYEYPPIEGRLLGWMTHLYRADGLLFWHVNFWGRNRNLDPSDTFFPAWDTFSGLHMPGDGIFLYPTTEGIVPGIRLAQMRDAVEDYERLQLAASKAGTNAVDEISRTLITSMTDYTRSPGALRAARARLGDLIEAPRTVVFKPETTEVVISPTAPSTVLFAAREATNFLSQVLGTAIPLVRAPTTGRISLILGTNEWSWTAGLSTADLPRDAFSVRTMGNRVFIAGPDDETVDVPRRLAGGSAGRFACGTLFGVYDFLERQAGVRFYFPGEMGTVVPMRQEIVVPCGEWTTKPDFAYRDCYVSGAGAWPGVTDAKDVRRLKALYQLRLRECLDRPRCCHGQNRFNIAERFSETHPEYFQMRKDGSRCTGTKFEHNWQGRQLCHTSPVWDLIRDETLERIRKGETSVDVMPQDGMQPCWCPTCQARFNTTNFSLASGYATELIWSNTVAVAQAITAAGLKGEVAQMAYGTYRDLPSFEIPKNVNLVLAVGGPWSESHPGIRDRQIDFVRGWAQKLGRPVSWIWTYPMKNYGRLQAPDVPQHAPHAYWSFYRRTAPYIQGSFVESNGDNLHLIHNYLNFYMFSKFAWDHSFDVDAALEEHHRLMFGAGAAEMAKFFDRLEALWIGRVAIPSVIGETEIGPIQYAGPSELDLWTKIYTPAVIQELGGYVTRARTAVPADSLFAKRIDWIREGFHSPLEKHAGNFLKDLSVEAELKRRAEKKSVNLLDGLSFSLPKGCVLDKETCVTATGAYRLVSTNRVYAGCSLKGKLKPNTKYRVSYFIKLDRLGEGDKNSGHGACVEYEEYKPVYKAERGPKGAYWKGTRDWLHQSFEFTTGPAADNPEARPNLWLRIFGAAGTVWFDGVSLEEI